MPSSCWKPGKQDTSSISSGDKKVRMHTLKVTEQVIDSHCPNCSKEMLLHVGNGRYMTHSGSYHDCNR